MRGYKDLRDELVYDNDKHLGRMILCNVTQMGKGILNAITAEA